jgi:GDP-L-fucose synthase
MNDIILVTGGTGMVGKAIKRVVEESNNLNKFVFVGSRQYDLTKTNDVDKLFKEINPTKIIHLAAKVGGVKANTDFVADFFNQNILINTNVLMKAHENNVQNVVSLLSTCVYPDSKYISYPLEESMLHLGPPHDSNFGYAYAKRMVEVQSKAFRKQHGRNYTTAIPNNLYGLNDNFDLEMGHVIPAVIRKIYEAKNDITKGPLTFWGDGSALREFTFADDLAKDLLMMIGEYNNTSIYNGESPLNIGSSEEVSIKELVECVARIFNYIDPITWDVTKPNGQHKKPSMKNNMLSSHYTPLKKGLTITCDWFGKTYPELRGIERNDEQQY